MSMPDASGVATPTDAERQLAHRIWNDVLCNSEVPAWRRDDLLAQALADQRAKYEAVADELDERYINGDGKPITSERQAGKCAGYSLAAHMIREASAGRSIEDPGPADA